MLKYITMVYQGEKYHEEFGWEFGEILLFQSAEHDTQADAMEEFSKFKLPEDKAWFAYMRVTENGEIKNEEQFDTSTVKSD
jgi:hypothetical protein